jgi:hypothetical protein
MKAITQTLVLLVFIFTTATTVFATGETTMKPGYITLASISSSLPSVAVDKSLNGIVDAGGGDGVDKNWVKVWVNTSPTSGFYAILNSNMVSDIKYRARNAGDCKVMCKFSLYDSQPYGIEVDPNSVKPGSRMSKDSEGAIFGYVTGMQ